MDLTARLLSLAPLVLNDPTGPSEEPPPSEKGPSARTVHQVTQVQHRLETQEILELVQAYVAGSTVKQLTARFRLDRTTVLAHLDRQGITRRPNGRKLSDEEVAEAARLYRDGWSLRRLGQHLGVDDETVRQRLLKAGVQLRAQRGTSH